MAKSQSSRIAATTGHFARVTEMLSNEYESQKLRSCCTVPLLATTPRNLARLGRRLSVDLGTGKGVDRDRASNVYCHYCVHSTPYGRYGVIPPYIPDIAPTKIPVAEGLIVSPTHHVLFVPTTPDIFLQALNQCYHIQTPVAGKPSDPVPLQWAQPDAYSPTGCHVPPDCTPGYGGLFHAFCQP